MTKARLKSVQTMKLDGIEIPYTVMVVRDNLMIIKRRRGKKITSDIVWVICHAESKRMIGKPFKHILDAHRAINDLTGLLKKNGITLQPKVVPGSECAAMLKDWEDNWKYHYADGYNNQSKE